MIVALKKKNNNNIIFGVETCLLCSSLTLQPFEPLPRAFSMLSPPLPGMTFHPVIQPSSNCLQYLRVVFYSLFVFKRMPGENNHTRD